MMLTISSFLLLLLWVRVWSNAERELYFNPYLSGATRLVDRLVAFLRPVFGRLPDRTIVLAIMGFVLLFRAAVVFNNTAANWSVTIGGATFERVLRTDRLSACLIFSIFAFLLFLTRIWTLELLLDWFSGPRRADRAAQALRFAAQPASRLDSGRKAAAIILVNMLVIRALDIAGTPATRSGLQALPSGPDLLDWSGAPIQALMRALVLAVAGAADVLLIAQNMMVIGIMVSIAAALLHKTGLHGMAQEWIQLLLGRFGRPSTAFGGLQLAPLFFLLLVPMAYLMVLAILTTLLSATG